MKLIFSKLETLSKLSFLTKIKGYISLLKLRLSSLVVMSAFFGYLLAGGNLSSIVFFELIMGGILITGSSNGFNQIIESTTDALMTRTSTIMIILQVLLIKLKELLFQLINLTCKLQQPEYL